ncbi:MAG TPA: DNA polymerase III subunit alpha [Stellaceae bacterium]|jgi:DNA polymerase-3 subunit alpha|nr:DNA polymerase III subunit alpha [Stellaceae bacterium]
MSHADFIHLRVHSAYSLAAGAIKVKALVDLAKKNAMPAVAMTDTGNLFGALEFAIAAAESGVQPLVGCELGLRRADVENVRLAARMGPALLPDPIVLLVQSETGYRNLLALVSKSFLETSGGEVPQIDIAALEGHSDGLIALTGGPTGAVGRLLLDGQKPAAEAMLLKLAALFPGRLYVELLRHGMPNEERIENDLIDLAYRHDVPLVATNDAFFPDPSYEEAHDVLLCIAEGVVQSEPNRRRLTGQHYFKSPAEMRLLFADIPEACDNTLVIAQRCAYMPEPRKPILPPFPMDSGRKEEEEVRIAALAGLEARLAAQVYRAAMSEGERETVAKPYRERLEFELDVIIKMGFAGYFLIVAEFIQWAKAQGIPVGPGRGSGAGSVVAWALTITDIDPLRFGLIFERFLNPERVSMPDFDVDFCQERRDEVIRHVQQKYGHDRVAQIITFGKLQARAVLRDVGRVLGMPYGQVDKICKLVPNNPANPVTLKDAINGEPALQQMRDEDESVARLIAIALKLEGLYRHASTHAAGVVIGDRRLDELVPLYRDPRSDMPVTEFSMKYVELAGLVKFDFLGLKTLDVLAKAVDLIAARGTPLDLAALPLDDAKTYALIARGDTHGIFQLESSGMRDSLRKLKPNRFEDIIAMNALYRPGPMDSIPSYIKRKNGEEPVSYPHELLAPILQPTYGVFTYQEQVMQAAQIMADYSLGGADLLRRAMGKKIKSEMVAQRANFVAGAVKKGIDEAQANFVFDLMEKFSGYGFNKSHSAPYALIAYQTAYLKANHPVEFLAASMTLDLGNTDKLNEFRQECARLAIRLLPPDINRSEVEFSVEAAKDGAAIRYALAAVKGVGAAAMREILAERKANGPFKDLFDFARRLDVKSFNRRQFENLIRAGAFDALNPNRAQSFAAIDLLLRHASVAAEERASQQVSLFGGAGDAPGQRPALPQAQDWSALDRLQQEFAALGFYLSSHPLDAYGKSLARVGVVRFAELSERLAGGGSTRFKLAGIVIGRKERSSSEGRRFAFVQMSDASGTFEITLFSEVLAQARELLDSGKPLLVTVDIRADDDALRLTAQRLEPLERIVAQAAAGLKVVLGEAGALAGFKSLLQAEAGGRGHVNVVVSLPTREVEIALPGGFRIGPQVLSAVQRLPGVLSVQEI